MGKLSAQILSADLANLADAVKAVHEHADVIHVDVMDGRFVPRLTIGPVVVASVRPHTGRTVHAHLLVEAPEVLFDELAEAGADVVSFHVEAVRDPASVIAKARGAGMGVGLAVVGGSLPDGVLPHLDDVDDVIVMGVRPGRAREAVFSDALTAVESVRREIDRRGLSTNLEMEGDVTLDTARRCVEAGANVLVAGSAIFGADGVAAAARALRAVVEAA